MRLSRRQLPVMGLAAAARPAIAPALAQVSPGGDAAPLWRDAVNRRGGDVTVVHLPEIGVRGNTHFALSDLNNVDIADLMSGWLREKRLD